LRNHTILLEVCIWGQRCRVGRAPY
jgi:hypothetical protein